MKKSVKGWKLLILAVLLALCVAAIFMHHTIWAIWMNMTQQKIPLPEGESWDGGTYTRLAYGEDTDQYIDLYVPSSSEPVPLFVLVHGGGFVSGDAHTRQARFMYRYFRDHGFACASVNYRLAQKAIFPAAVDDVRAAVHYLSGHASEYGYLPDHLAIWGESAGGYLAAYEAITEDEVDISALVDYYGVMDFPSMTSQFREEGIPQWLVKIANGWIGDLGGEFESFEEYWIGSRKDTWDDELLTKTSVIRIARGHTANSGLKTLILHGDADITVPYHQSELLSQALGAACGDENVLYRLLPGLNHASDLFYADERLSEVESFIRDAVGIKKEQK